MTKEFRMRFKATPLALATALAFSSAPSGAADLMESYTQARQSDPVLSISESQNYISAEGVVQSRSPPTRWATAPSSVVETRRRITA